MGDEWGGRQNKSKQARRKEVNGWIRIWYLCCGRRDINQWNDHEVWSFVPFVPFEWDVRCDVMCLIMRVASAENIYFSTQNSPLSSLLQRVDTQVEPCKWRFHFLPPRLQDARFLKARSLAAVFAYSAWRDAWGARWSCSEVILQPIRLRNSEPYWTFESSFLLIAEEEFSLSSNF